MSREEASKDKSSAALSSVVAAVALTTFKLIVGLLTNSLGILAEAAHSALDLVAAAVTFFAVRAADKPSDKEHPFGHGKVENISGTIEALLIFLAAGWIIVEATHKLRNPAPMEAAGWGVAVMMLSAVANTIVSKMLFATGRKTGSAALLADGWHLRTDVWTSAGVIAGIEVLRAQVQMQAQQQRVIFYENEFAKQKLALERAIGPLISGTYRIGITLTGGNANDHRTVQLLGWTLVSERLSIRSGRAGFRREPWSPSHGRLRTHCQTGPP